MKSTLKMAVLAAAMGLLGMACGGVGGGAGTVSCTSGSGSSLSCFEWNWSGGAYTDVWTQACTQAGNTAGTGCSHAGAVGGCKTTTTAGTIALNYTIWIYSGTLAEAQSTCTSLSATFVAP